MRLGQPQESAGVWVGGSLGAEGLPCRALGPVRICSCADGPGLAGAGVGSDQVGTFESELCQVSQGKPSYLRIAQTGSGLGLSLSTVRPPVLAAGSTSRGHLTGPTAGWGSPPNSRISTLGLPPPTLLFLPAFLPRQGPERHPPLIPSFPLEAASFSARSWDRGGL